MPDGNSLLSAYSRAGHDFLAAKLEGMFRRIETEEDKALHNVIQKEVMLMVGSQQKEVNKFYRLLAEMLLTDNVVRKRFREMVAEALKG